MSGNYRFQQDVPRPNLSIFSDHPPDDDPKPKRKHRRKIKPATTQVHDEPIIEPGLVFSWQDPYPVDRRKESTSLYLDIISQLQQRPGVWALIFISKSDKRRHGLKRRGCEVTSRTRSDGMREIYARWPE